MKPVSILLMCLYARWAFTVLQEMKPAVGSLCSHNARYVVKSAKLFRAIIHWLEITGFEEPLESVIYLQMIGCLPSCLEPQASARRGREQNI